MDQLEKSIWETVRALNHAWTTEHDADKLANYFHREMVAITPSDRQRLDGQAECLAGWKQFMDIARIHTWKEIDPKIQLYGGDRLAVVTYYYEMTCTINNQKLDLKGRDMMVLVHEDGRWQLVADQFSPYPGR